LTDILKSFRADHIEFDEGRDPATDRSWGKSERPAAERRVSAFSIQRLKARPFAPQSVSAAFQHVRGEEWRLWGQSAIDGAPAKVAEARREPSASMERVGEPRHRRSPAGERMGNA
jgi:hypothetical protein